MLRFVPAVCIMFFLLSCGVTSGRDYQYQTDEKQHKITLERKAFPGQTAFEITLAASDLPLGIVAQFCVEALERFGDLSVPYDPSRGTVRIGPEKDLYRLFFQLGVFSLPDFRNGLLRTGFIQIKWREWVEASAASSDPVSVLLKKETYDLFRITDFRDMISNYGVGSAELGEIYSYAVTYLLREVLFVSLQEILSRPYRYDQTRDSDSFFSQMVTVPEAMAFTGYLVKKYGESRILRAAKTDFSTNSWKREIGEEFHDTEADFTALLEGKKYEGIFRNAEFAGKLDDLLKLYNSMTKTTLFRK